MSCIRMASCKLSISVQVMDWQHARPYAEPIRKLVFIEEQSVPEVMEWDEQDEAATHAVAFDTGGSAVGYARLLNSGQLGRMAVLPEYRRQGIGTALLQALETYAGLQHYDYLFLHAQVHALSFYEKQGYRTEGDVYDEAGIPHLNMYKSIAE